MCDQLICLFVSVTKDFQPWGLEPEFLQIMKYVSAFHFTNNVIFIVHTCTFLESYSAKYQSETNVFQ